MRVSEEAAAGASGLGRQVRRPEPLRLRARAQLREQRVGGVVLAGERGLGREDVLLDEGAVGGALLRQLGHASSIAGMRVQDLFDLSGKTAVVTGGGSGIGRQMATGLAELGANLVLCARKVQRCQDAADELAALGVRALALRCDVRSADDVQAVVRTTLEELGSLDVLVNNAGTSWGAPVEDTPLEGWQKVLDVNLTGTFLFSQAAGRAMIERGGGSIVNIASVAGLRGSPPGAMDAIAYTASKGGVISFTRDLAQSGRGTASASTRSPRAGSRPTCRSSCSSGTATASSRASRCGASAARTTSRARSGS